MARRWSSMLRTPMGATAFGAVLVLVALAVIGPMVWGDAAGHHDVSIRNQPSSSAHLLGTDSLGRDVLARVLVATRLTLVLTVLATVIGVASGLVLGTLASVLGRRAGRLVAGLVDILVAFPGLLIALFLAVAFGVGNVGAVLAIGLAMAPHFARLTQTLTASVSGKDYVRAARVVGVGPVRRLVRHVLPNIGEPLIIQATLGAGAALVSFTGLSFLGLGVQPPEFDWGRLLNEGLNRIYTNPVAALAPGIAVTLAGVALQLLGESLAAVVGIRSGPNWWRGRRLPLAGPRTRSAATEEPLLRVENLRVSFPGPAGPVVPVDGVSFDVAAGEMVGVVGESGSGKSLTALAVAGLVPLSGRVAADRLSFRGKDLVAGGRENRALLGVSMAMVFQDPMMSLNPALRVGRQLSEVAEVHLGLSRVDADRRAVDRLREVLVPEPEHRARQYPHELSGGMRQRAMIGTGLMGTPRMLIADEPTTALDVTVQQEVLRLLRRVRDDAGTATLLISHDIAVVSVLCDRILVMYAGTVVEDLPVRRLLDGPAHPYTRALLATVVQLDVDRDQPLPTIPGRPPEPAGRPAGCPFAPRCAHADARCESDRPTLAPLGSGHRIACWHPQHGRVPEATS